MDDYPEKMAQFNREHIPARVVHAERRRVRDGNRHEREVTEYRGGEGYQIPMLSKGAR